MRVAHWITQLDPGSLPACTSTPVNTRERAVGTAENGSTRDSSEAVSTAVKEDSCHPPAGITGNSHRNQLSKGGTSVIVFTNFLNQVSQSC